jgi:hypothetical protein
LEGWRAHLAEDPGWHPYRDGFARHRNLTPAQEEDLARHLRDSFINRDLYCPRSQLAASAKELWLAERADAHRNGDWDFRVLDYKPPPSFGASWQRRFMKSVDLSSRTPHLLRRTPPKDEVVAQFLEKTQNIFACYQGNLTHFINMDETSWQVIPNRVITISNKGQEQVKCVFDGNQKDRVTVIASISAAGEKLPLWLIAQGITDRCESKFRNDEFLARAIANGKLVITHSPNGWMNSGIAESYLAWLRDRLPTGDLALVWDGYSAHENDYVMAKAKERHIDITFVPHGQTGNWQPLDHRIFGELKSRARARFSAAHLGQLRPALSKVWSARILIQCWDSIEEENISQAWTILEE